MLKPTTLLKSAFKADLTKSTGAIGKSIKGSSNVAGLLRSAPEQKSDHDILMSHFKLNAELFDDTRSFATSSATASSTAADAVPDANKGWQENSNAKEKDKGLVKGDDLAMPQPDGYDFDPNQVNNPDGSIGHDGFGNGDRGFGGIPNDGNHDPLYDATKHSKEENEKISNMMTIMNSSSSSETSKANAQDGEKFTKAFTDSILSGKSLQETMKLLDGKNLGSQTSQAYNTENMSEKEISINNKAHGTAIILRGSNQGVAQMMQKDEENITKAYKELGLDVKVVHSEKEFETALMDAREKAITDKADGKESILATHVIAHGFKAGGPGGHNNEDATGGLAMQGGGTYMEKDIMGDIAGALELDENGESPFEHSYNSFTSCHSGCMDNKQAFQENNGQDKQGETQIAQNDTSQTEQEKQVS